jgi:hypothetical protein
MEGTRRSRLGFEQHGWPIAAAAMRRFALSRALEADKVTVITVGYKSVEFLPVFSAALGKYWDDRIARVLVIDNASSDGSREWLGERKQTIDSACLPVNILHGPALDLGVFLSRTEFFVTLDIDAFPIRHGWLDKLLVPLHDGSHVAGARFEGLGVPYAHPCFLGMATARFLESGHSFASVRRGRRLIFDTGASISHLEASHVALVEPTAVRGPEFIGTVYGDAVYHLFFGTRAKRTNNRGLSDTATEADRAWNEAVDTYLR